MKCFTLVLNTILANTVLARIDGPSNKALTQKASPFPTCTNVRSIDGRKRLCNDVRECKTVCDKNECTTKYEYGCTEYKRQRCREKWQYFCQSFSPVPSYKSNRGRRGASQGRLFWDKLSTLFSPQPQT